MILETLVLLKAVSTFESITIITIILELVLLLIGINNLIQRGKFNAQLS